MAAGCFGVDRVLRDNYKKEVVPHIARPTRIVFFLHVAWASFAACLAYHLHILDEFVEAFANSFGRGNLRRLHFNSAKWHLVS